MRNALSLAVATPAAAGIHAIPPQDDPLRERIRRETEY